MKQNMIFTAAAMVLSLSAISAQANTWCDQHPRRCADSARENIYMQRRINNGSMNEAQREAIEQQIAEVHAQQRAMVEANGGHLTAAQQTEVSGELNYVSQEIYAANHGQ